MRAQTVKPLPCPARSNADFSQQMKATLAAGGLFLPQRENAGDFRKLGDGQVAAKKRKCAALTPRTAIFFERRHVGRTQDGVYQ